MAFFDFLKKKEGNDIAIQQQEKEFSRVLKSIVEETLDKSDTWSIPSVTTTDSFKELKKKDIDYRKTFLYYVLQVAAPLKEEWKQKKTYDYYGKSAGKFTIPFKVASQLMKQDIFFNEDEWSELVKLFTAAGDDQFHFVFELPYNAILDKVSLLIIKNGLTDKIKTTLQSLLSPENPYMYAERRKVNEKIRFLLQGSPDAGFNKHDSFGKLLDVFMHTLDPQQQKAWTDIFNSCINAASKSAPSAKWLSEIKKLVEITGEERFVTALKEWIGFNKELIKAIHKNGNYSADFLRDENHNLLKGLIWTAGIVNNPELNTVMDEYAAWAYRKKPGVGPISAKTGTACMYAFEMLPFKEGISRLVKFKIKIKNNTILKSIDKIIKQAAEKSGISEDVIMELGVPDFGINEKAQLIKPFKEYNAVYSIKSVNDTELQWEKEGKIQKSLPQSIKTEMASEIKAFKNTIKEIEELLPVQKERIEKLYLNQSTWNFEDWFQNYILHPLISIIAKKLIWHFSNTDTEKAEGIFHEGNFIDSKGAGIDWISNATTVQLWHPIGFTSDEILQWRKFLQQNEIRQPFKQAYREIYLLTDAEINTDTYSNRFAAHILRQHQFAALCRLRGWNYHLMGQWDSHNTPVLQLSKWNMTAEYYVDSDWEGVANEAGIFNYISTDQVRFYKGQEQLHLTDVPAMVFTEVMRDVDLFVGVTSIGNDAGWQDTGDNRMNEYWHNYSFAELTESSKVRSEVLKNLIPRLKIVDKCGFDGKYLLVKGKLRNYKIHMGSGNILMEPNDQYLCIVPDGSGKKSTEKIFLPFEGDNMLSIIISKAFLLTDDDKITDTTITRQIKG